MSYVSLGNVCQIKNQSPFTSQTQPVKTVLLSNFGGISYPSKHDPLNPNTMYQCDGRSTFKNAYSVQMNPYLSCLCKQ